MRTFGTGTVPLLIVILLSAVGCEPKTPAANADAPAAQRASISPRDALVARAKSLELDTPYVPPPGDPLEHHTAGYAKIMCSAVFITGLDPEVATESVGYFTSPHQERAKVGKPVIDRAKKEVRISLPNGVTRVARYYGSQGCVALPTGKDDVFFKPVAVKSKLPSAKQTPWPMGDVLPKDPLPAGLDAAKLKQAIDAAFDPADAMTAAFVVTYKGRLVGERYMDGITHTTPLESWSMGKSVTATLMGVLIQQGAYQLDQAAPIPEWQSPGDPRAKIRISDILRMSSGIRIKAPGDIPTTTRTGRIPITSTSTQALWIRSSSPPRGRSSGRRTRSGAIATPIPCSSTTSFGSASRSAVKSICRSRSATSSTRSASGRW
jgi:hypothetical protein